MHKRIRRPGRTLGVAFAAATLIAACADDPGTSTEDEAIRDRQPTLTPQTSGTTNRLQAVAAVNDRVVWVSGLGGSILRTDDGGATWAARGIPGTETLQFRDLHAVDENTAYVLTNNGGPNARIYKTVDAGLSWTLDFQSPVAVVFYDCFAFFDKRHAVAIPDAEDGHFDVIRMTDGHTWENIGDRFPAGQPGEGLFPTSGTCVSTFGHKRAWAAMGGGAEARMILTTDGGDSWSSHPIPMGGTATSGGISVLFRDRRHGILGGGELATPTVQQLNFARSSDGGLTWQLAAPAPFPGPLYSLAYLPDDDRAGKDADDRDDRRDRVRILATGPGGAAWSNDEGDNWQLMPAEVTGYYGASFASKRTGWMVGTNGRILRVDF